MLRAPIHCSSKSPWFGAQLGGPNTSPGFCGHLHACARTHTQTLSLTHDLKTEQTNHSPISQAVWLRAGVVAHAVTRPGDAEGGGP